MTVHTLSVRMRMMGLHEKLDAQFARHQRALLDRDYVRAASWLGSYREQLAVHMQDEERYVLPLYQNHGGDASDAPAKLFLGEHARMREFLEKIGDATAALANQPDDDKLLVLLDLEATYKNLLLHHDLRERNALYPRLEEWVSADELARVSTALRSC